MSFEAMDGREAIDAWGFSTANVGEVPSPPIKSAAPVKAMATVCIYQFFPLPEKHGCSALAWRSTR